MIYKIAFIVLLIFLAKNVFKGLSTLKDIQDQNGQKPKKKAANDKNDDVVNAEYTVIDD